MLNLDTLELFSMNNVHFLSGNKAMNQTNNITMKKPLNEPKVNPRDRFIIWLPCDNNARLNILVNILEMIKVDMNSKVNEKEVMTQSSIKTIWLNLAWLSLAWAELGLA